MNVSLWPCVAVYLRFLTMCFFSGCMFRLLEFRCVVGQFIFCVCMCVVSAVLDVLLWFCCWFSCICTRSTQNRSAVEQAYWRSESYTNHFHSYVRAHQRNTSNKYFYACVCAYLFTPVSALVCVCVLPRDRETESKNKFCCVAAVLWFLCCWCKYYYKHQAAKTYLSTFLTIYWSIKGISPKFCIRLQNKWEFD